MITFKQFINEKNYDDLPYAIFTSNSKGEWIHIWIREKWNKYSLKYEMLQNGNWISVSDKYAKYSTLVSYESLAGPNRNTITRIKTMSRPEFEEFALLELY